MKLYSDNTLLWIIIIVIALALSADRADVKVDLPGPKTQDRMAP